MDEKDPVEEAKASGKALWKEVKRFSRRQSLKRWAIFGAFTAANYFLLYSEIPELESRTHVLTVAVIVTGIGWLSSWVQRIYGIGDGVS